MTAARAFGPDPRIEQARKADYLALAGRLGARLKPVTAGRIEWAGPCPRCGGKDRFSVNTAKGVFNCRGSGDRNGDQIAMVRHVLGLDFAEALEFITSEARAAPAREPLPSPANTADPPGDRQRAALWLWRQRQPIVEGSPAWCYLRLVRKIKIAIPATLGFLPANGEHPPSLIAAYGLATEPEPGVLAIDDSGVRAVHLTRLTPDGHKVETEPVKITVGNPLGSPIILSPLNDGLGLVITEGNEDGLSVFEPTKLGLWSAGSSSYMPALAPVIPDWIDFVTICAHRDPAGEAKAAKLHAALKLRKIKSRVMFLDGATP